MFGKKKKKKIASENILNVNSKNSRFSVQTMADDLKKSANTGVQTVTQIKEVGNIKKNKPSSIRKSGSQKSITPSAQKPTEQNNPFFADGAMAEDSPFNVGGQNKPVIEAQKEIVMSTKKAPSVSTPSLLSTSAPAPTTVLAEEIGGIVDKTPENNPYEGIGDFIPKSSQKETSLPKQQEEVFFQDPFTTNKRSQSDVSLQEQTVAPMQEFNTDMTKKNLSIAPRGQEQSQGTSITPATRVPQETQDNFFLSDDEATIATPIKGKGGHIMRIVGIFIVVGILIGGAIFGWLWWSNQKSQKQIAEEKLAQEEQAREEESARLVEEKGDDLEGKQHQYFIDLPNYLTLPSKESAHSDLDTQLKTISDNILTQDISTPIFFLMTDKNGAPMSFRNFAIAVGIDFSDDVFAHLGNQFEVYANNDGGDVYYGMSIDILNKEALRDALLAMEGDLPNALRPLLENKELRVEGNFSDSVYYKHNIRYINLSSTDLSSVDYVIADDNHLYIGTSKNTLRKILDHNFSKSIVSDEVMSDDTITEGASLKSLDSESMDHQGTL